RVDLRGVHELEPEPDVRLVGAEALHGLAKGESRKRSLELDAKTFAPDRGHQPLDGGKHVLFGHEAHLEIDLGVFGLAVGAQVLVAKTTRDLEVAIAPG